MLSHHYQCVVTYGQRFHVLRRELWKGKGKTVLALARRMDSPYAATIYNIERQWRVPLLPTLMRHAAALGCRPWELLVGVETEYDLVRQLATLRVDEADRRWRELLRKYKESTERVSRSDTTSQAIGKSAPKRHGRDRAQRGSTEQPPSIPDTPGATLGAVATDLVREVRNREAQLARGARQQTATARPAAAGVRARARRDRR